MAVSTCNQRSALILLRGRIAWIPAHGFKLMVDRAVWKRAKPVTNGWAAVFEVGQPVSISTILSCCHLLAILQTDQSIQVVTPNRRLDLDMQNRVSRKTVAFPFQTVQTATQSRTRGSRDHSNHDC
jgi:hypothetical protein